MLCREPVVDNGEATAGASAGNEQASKDPLSTEEEARRVGEIAPISTEGPLATAAAATA
jgi:hypothetical protein